MPHKHTRPPSSLSTAHQTHDLPPTTLARPLPVSKSKPSTSSTKSNHPPKKNPRHKPPSNSTDDTPRAFTRLMTYALTGLKTPRGGLDDGLSHPDPNSNKKRKRDQDPAAPPPQPGQPNAIPKILPGERMADYNARVDAALPVAGLVGKSKRGVMGVGGGGGERQSRLEKRMQRMQREWREEEGRRREWREEAREEEGDGNRGEGGVVGGKGKKIKKKKKGKRRKGSSGRGGVGKDGGGVGGSYDNKDNNPWAIIAANRQRELAEKEKGNAGGGGLVGLHDVVQAPPKFERVPKRRKVQDGDMVGDVVRKGGLKRLGELGEARRSVVEGYRRMMRERREGQG
ncbi:MAG: hypothetical protein Q9208_008289 [Pyrenodesmia sp. 3 TL-2023]